jgi:hypothetical protein
MVDGIDILTPVNADYLPIVSKHGQLVDIGEEPFTLA